MKRIEEIVQKEGIDCDFRKVNGYLFAYLEEEEKDLDLEAEAYRTLGIPGEIVKIDARISPYKALKVPDQANFNVQKYLKGLTDVLLKNRVRIFEKTRIVDVHKDDGPEALTAEGHKIRAKWIIIATHYPIHKGFNFYFLKMIPKFSYSVLTPPVNLEIEDANYISAGDAPSLALRFVLGEGGKMLNISGASHEAKVFVPYEKQLQILKNYGETHFGISEYPYEWCTQDYGCTDDVPLIGKADEGIFIMAAYNKWGMAASAAGALLIKDLVVNKYSKYAHLFRPERVKWNGKLLSYNLGMVATLLKTRNVPKRSVLKLEPGTGKVTRLGGKRIGIYKDEESRLHLVDATCPHLRCGLRFNPIEKTYDCKCHGSRFNYKGKLLDGPALRDLYRIEIEEVRKHLDK